MRLTVFLLLITGCAHEAIKPCLTIPPPSLKDHEDKCKQFDPSTQTRAAFDCAMWRLNMYLAESSKWSSYAWDKCSK
jgi:hypothetical protein